MSACLMLLAPAALADIISVGDYVKLTAYNSLDSAGIMTYAVSKDQGNSIAFYYDTFCIQDNVYIYPSVWYPVAALSTIVGPYNPVKPGEGPLNGAVDYLFYQYKSGVYNTIMTSLETEADFQKVLWSLQGSGPEYPNDDPSTSTTYPWDTDLITYNNTVTMHQSWGTQVINIVDRNFCDIQNQLYNPVPEPSTVLLVGTGLACLVGMRRRGKQ
jgi:hypothetical protein